MHTQTHRIGESRATSVLCKGKTGMPYMTEDGQFFQYDGKSIHLQQERKYVMTLVLKSKHHVQDTKNVLSSGNLKIF